ncbi:MAG: ORF6N domain-containing protein [Nanoarchaeota archaeon]
MEYYERVLFAIFSHSLEYTFHPQLKSWGIPRNKAVKRNIERFPEDFMFQINKVEFENLMFQIGTSSYSYGGRRKLPNVFTEQGVTALSGVLKSKKAIEINIQIVRAFVSMRSFLSRNFELINEIYEIKKKHIEYDDKINQLFGLLEKKELKEEKGIFYDGQLFDAYKFISDLVRKANKEIILIDNYVDDRTLNFFIKRKYGVKVIIYTKKITYSLRQDLKKFNSQYESIEVKEFNNSHDRFLIIDGCIYHIGASLKDVGKKWFAFSKFENSKEILDKLIEI